MGKSTAQQSTATDFATSITGANNKYQEAGSVSLGNSNKLTGTDLTHANVAGNVTIGETGTANTFAQAITRLFESNAENTARLFEAVNPPSAPAPVTPAAAEASAFDLKAFWEKWKKPITYAAVAGVALTALLLWRPWKR